MKNLRKKIGVVVVAIYLFSTAQIKADCYEGNCPFSEIDCSQCCKAGHFVSAECLRACNCSLDTGYKADMAHAAGKDYPGPGY